MRERERERETKLWQFIKGINKKQTTIKRNNRKEEKIISKVQEDRRFCRCQSA
jgi:hypothetical protein